MDLEEYKSTTGIDPEKEITDADIAAATSSSSMNADDLSQFFTGGTLGIDMGSSGLKLAHRSSTANRALYKDGKPASPIVSVDREGYRSIPSLAWMPSDDEKEGEEMLIGRLAEARLYDTRDGTVVHPRDALEDNAEANIMQQTIRAAASNALDQVMGSDDGATTSTSSSMQNTNPLFVLDASMSTRGSYNVRPTVTYPPHMKNLQQYQEAMNSMTSPAGICEFIPEPIAIVSGAKFYNLLPPNTGGGGSVLVVDVGGKNTCISIVGGGEEGDGSKEEVMYSATLPFGGDTFVDLLVSHLAKDFYGSDGDKDDHADDGAIAALSTKPKLNDPTALQRLYESSTTAIHELSNKTRSDINIPYLTMDLTTRQPKHLEVGMARSVAEAEVETWVQNQLVPHLQSTSIDQTSPTNNSVLSQALPPPTNLSTLLSSAIMSSLEQTGQAPNTLRAILLVGGGARIPLVRKAMVEGVGYLAGPEGEKQLIMPEGEMGDELGVLGAAVWGSGGR